MPFYAKNWEERTEGDRVAFSIDWDQAIGSRLEFLRKQYEAGTTTPEQRDSYANLLRKLRELLPTIERLKLYVPPILQKV